MGAATAAARRSRKSRRAPGHSVPGAAQHRGGVRGRGIRRKARRSAGASVGSGRHIYRARGTGARRPRQAVFEADGRGYRAGQPAVVVYREASHAPRRDGGDGAAGGVAVRGCGSCSRRRRHEAAVARVWGRGVRRGARICAVTHGLPFGLRAGRGVRVEAGGTRAEGVVGCC